MKYREIAGVIASIVNPPRGIEASCPVVPTGSKPAWAICSSATTPYGVQQGLGVGSAWFAIDVNNITCSMDIPPLLGYCLIGPKPETVHSIF